MIKFLRSRFHRFLRKEEVLKKFYSDFDSIILDERKSSHEEVKRERGESSSAGLKDPKEEPASKMVLDLENRKYSFYLRPVGANCRLLV
jgi:hypothetical protein